MTPLGDSTAQAIKTLTTDTRQLRADLAATDDAAGLGAPQTYDRIEVSEAGQAFGGQGFTDQAAVGGEAERFALLSGDINAFVADEPAADEGRASQPLREAFQLPSRSIGELADVFARNAANYARAEAVRALGAQPSDAVAEAAPEPDAATPSDGGAASNGVAVTGDVAEIAENVEAADPSASARDDNVSVDLGQDVELAEDLDRSADAARPGEEGFETDPGEIALNADEEAGVAPADAASDDTEVAAADFAFEAAGDEAADAALNVALDASEGPAPEPADLAFEEFAR